jgi:hypothetical protein
MARLYIANCTRQKQVVCYRLDFTKEGEVNQRQNFQPARQQDVDAGRQVQLGSDFHKNQVVDIVEQLSRYGLIGCVDVPRMRADQFVPYVYNIDQPVPAETMRRVRDHNAGVKIRQGQDLRKKAAIAADNTIRQTVEAEFERLGIPAGPAEETTVTFEQLDQSEAGEKRIEEGMKVSPTAPLPKGKNAKPRQKKH